MKLYLLYAVIVLKNFEKYWYYFTFKRIVIKRNVANCYNGELYTLGISYIGRGWEISHIVRYRILTLLDGNSRRVSSNIAIEMNCEIWTAGSTFKFANLALVVNIALRRSFTRLRYDTVTLYKLSTRDSALSLEASSRTFRKKISVFYVH